MNKPFRWSSSSIEYVRSHYQEMSHRAIGEAIGRSAEQVRSLCSRFGLYAHHKFSQAECDYIKAHYRKTPTREIALKLGREIRHINACAKRLGLAKPQKSFGAEFDNLIREKHALGWSDQEICEAYGCDRHTVGFRRNRLGLPANQYSEHQRNRTREKTRRQCEAVGVKSLGEYRAKVIREMGVKNGWPDGLLQREVQILNALWEHGPMTRQQLCEKTGMKWRGVRTQMISNGAKTTYLGKLMKLGLVVSLGRIVQNGGSCKNTCLYSLNLWVERGPNVQQRNKERSHHARQPVAAMGADDAGGGNEGDQAGGRGGDGEGPGGQGKKGRREGDEVRIRTDPRRGTDEGRDVRAEQLPVGVECGRGGAGSVEPAAA